MCKVVRDVVAADFGQEVADSTEAAHENEPSTLCLAHRYHKHPNL